MSCGEVSGSQGDNALTREIRKHSIWIIPKTTKPWLFTKLTVYMMLLTSDSELKKRSFLMPLRSDIDYFLSFAIISSTSSDPSL
ncbi:MAG: hypothetical protein SRB2_00022 [Desulfobacteraceae bacterium Eth-SRB2]|nr:MAG: hypothetical protein SRB2_00022 [Desulfobacteraceae bacterium Eth-SRB2]